jgi:hypothetical protein
MKTKTRVRAGLAGVNHNETLVRDAKTTALRVKTKVKGGALTSNHSETLVRDKRRKR